ncbi:MAG: thiamine phosphate synthase [Mariniblastus sp.]|nr:thiamine phosphate synthase [Mariniblastus sp.]
MTISKPEESPTLRSSTYRILDASLNRASEGLRVIEDFLRLGLADRHLAESAKQARHTLTQTAGHLDSQERIASRDTINDVGCAIETDSEFSRDSAEDVVHANLARVQQSLRTLEEYGKTVASEFSRHIEQLRYRIYTLEKAVLTTLLSRQNLSDVRLCVLIDSRPGQGDFEELVNQLIEAEVGLLQLRDKQLNDRQLVATGLRLTELTRGTRTRWIMNDRADLALAAGAAGVHLGQQDLPVAEARKMVGAAMLIGISTHDLDQARQAVLEGANYIGVGPVFPSRTKSFDQYPGLELLRQVASEIQLPSFAIGGIDQENVAEVRRAGFDRVAVRQCIVGADQPGEAAVDMKSELLSPVA